MKIVAGKIRKAWARCSLGAVVFLVFMLFQSGPLGAQSMMEYTAQQSAVQAVTPKVKTPLVNAARPSSKQYEGQVLEQQNSAAGKFLYEVLPQVFEKIRSLFVDADGKVKWGTVVAALLLVLILMKLGKPS